HAARCCAAYRAWLAVAPIRDGPHGTAATPPHPLYGRTRTPPTHSSLLSRPEEGGIRRRRPDRQDRPGPSRRQPICQATCRPVVLASAGAPRIQRRTAPARRDLPDHAVRERPR